MAVGINLLRRFLKKGVLVELMKMLGSSNPESYFISFNELLCQDTMRGLVKLIHYGDSQSMAHSVECRLPYTDYRLVEFLASVPDVYKVYNGWTKFVLRMAMEGALPKSITWRKDKMGWPEPADFWLRGKLKEAFCHSIETSDFLRQLEAGYDVRGRIKSAEPIHGLVRLYNLSVWHRIFFEPRKRAHSPLHAAGLASESENEKLPYGEDSPWLAAGRLQFWEEGHG